MSSQAGATFIFTTLAGDATLTPLIGARIYEDIAAPGAALPYVVFQLYAPNDVMGVGAARLWSHDLWLVRAFAAQTSYKGALKTIADRINTVMHAASGTTIDGVVHACTREREIRMTETMDGGAQVRHLGGVYRIMAT